MLLLYTLWRQMTWPSRGCPCGVVCNEPPVCVSVGHHHKAVCTKSIDPMETRYNQLEALHMTWVTELASASERASVLLLCYAAYLRAQEVSAEVAFSFAGAKTVVSAVPALVEAFAFSIPAPASAFLIFASLSLHSQHLRPFFLSVGVLWTLVPLPWLLLPWLLQFLYALHLLALLSLPTKRFASRQ